ncbi:transporter (CPA2 family) [Melghiribacillus thermohalophilus]|uniref:Transporter (CPA2 family) n=1 Tax=Melghiribacillus thermohalophilus TaxID=1324956 RepID=A0A4R3MUA0_9BACI|nr:cation:proton antiporter [Melghiribacillus thermohalophilus]TCT19056.1 transporter (CPA2 family) [Melghiribacillus thermohalophilus]
MEQFPILLGAGIVLLFVFWFGFLSLKMKMPNVILYILLGIILAKWISHHEILHFASEIGIVILFFLLGLEFKLKRLGGIARKIWPAGLLDVFLNLGVVTFIGIWYGLDPFYAFLLGGVAYATSSSITAKLLGDTGRMANRESEFILGILIFEDLVAPIVVAIIIGLSTGEPMTLFDSGILVIKIFGITVAAIILGKTVFKKFDQFLNKIHDEDFKIALFIGIALSYGGLALWLGLSEVLGAFLAGMMLSDVERIERVEQTVHPIQNLVLPIFFVYFGTTIQFVNGVPMLPLLAILVFWSIAGKMLVGIIGGKLYGLSPRVSFRAGLSLCSRGEFSVIIASIATGVFKIFSGIYIVLLALIGMLLFTRAPQMTNKLFGKPVKKKKGLKVPGS